MASPDCFECKYGGLGHPCRAGGAAFCPKTAATALMTRMRLIRDDAGDDIGDADGDGDDVPGNAALEAVDWIIDCEYELVSDHPDLVPAYILALMNAVETGSEAAFVAAGAVENAVVKHGPEIIGALEAMCAASPKARYILSGVWSQSGTVEPDVWARLGNAVGAGPHMDDDARTPSDGSPRHVATTEELVTLLRQPVALT